MKKYTVWSVASLCRMWNVSTFDFSNITGQWLNSSDAFIFTAQQCSMYFPTIHQFAMSYEKWDNHATDRLFCCGWNNARPRCVRQSRQDKSLDSGTETKKRLLTLTWNTYARTFDRKATCAANSATLLGNWRHRWLHRRCTSSFFMVQSSGQVIAHSSGLLTITQKNVECLHENASCCTHVSQRTRKIFSVLLAH